MSWAAVPLYNMFWIWCDGTKSDSVSLRVLIRDIKLEQKLIQFVWRHLRVPSEYHKGHRSSVFIFKYSFSFSLDHPHVLHQCVQLVCVVLYSELCSFTLKGILCQSPLYNLLCGRSVALVILPTFIMIKVALLPVLLILFSYTRIILISYQSSKEVRIAASQTNIIKACPIRKFAYFFNCAKCGRNKSLDCQI